MSVSQKPLIHCNKCGENCMRGWEDVQDFYGLAAEFSTGYLSKDFPDGLLIRFVLCERCVAELVKTFKTPPQSLEYLSGADNPPTA